MSQLAWYKQVTLWKTYAQTDLKGQIFPMDMPKEEVRAIRNEYKKIIKAVSVIEEYMALPTVYEYEKLDG